MAALRSALVAACLLASSGCGEDLNVGSANLDASMDAGGTVDAEQPRDRAEDDRLERMARDIAGEWELKFVSTVALRLHLTFKPGTRSGAAFVECLVPEWPCRPFSGDAGVDISFGQGDSGEYWLLELVGAKADVLIKVGGGVGFSFFYDPTNETLSFQPVFSPVPLTLTRPVAGTGSPKSDAGAP
jgi:hypothetical protein